MKGAKTMSETIKNKVKAAVVGGWMKDGVPQMISFIGAYDNVAEAFGEAYIYLDELIKMDEDDKTTITPIQDLEGDTGCAIYGKDEQNQIKYYAYILFKQEVMQNDRE